MKTLPLFPGGMPPQALDLSGPLRRNPKCSRCALGDRASSRCLPPAGEPGGILTVGSHPRRLENACGKVIADGAQGANLLSSIKRLWPGPVASCYAVGCYPGPDEGRDKAEPKHAQSCRPYLRSYAEQVAPKRILALGELACWGLLGRSISTRSVRRGFAWVRLPHGRVPVLILMDPQRLDGRHARAAWETDLKWALTTPDSFFEDRLQFLEDGTYSVIASEEDAREAATALRTGALELVTVNGTQEHNGLSWDVETVGKMHDDDFKIISTAVSVRGSNHAYVWDRPACTDPAVRQPLTDLIADPDLTFVEQGSYDENAALCYFKTGIGGQRRDTRLLRKALDSDVKKADLGTLSELVGAGGYKDEFDVEKEAARQLVIKWKPNQLALFDDCPDPYARQRLWEIYASKDRKQIDDYEGSYLYALTPRAKTSLYNARDTVVTGLLDALFWPQVQGDPGLSPLWAEVTGPASRSYGRAEFWGVPMSRSAILGIIGHAKAHKAQLEPQLRAHLSQQFRKLEWGSRDQVAQFFYTPKELGGLGLPVPKKTKNDKDALDKDALDFLAPLHPCATLYQAYAAMDVPQEKGEEFLRYLRQDGCVHPSVLLDGTRTGRPSCVAKGTLIEVARDVKAHPGGIPIEQVQVGDFAYCYDEAGDLRLRKVSKVWCSGVKHVIRVHWQGSGHHTTGYVDLTPEHLVRKTSGRWVRADSLKPLDRVYALSRGIPPSNNHEIVRIEVLNEPTEVWDLTVEGAHCFIANEICVHNCHDPNMFSVQTPEDCESCHGKGCEACDGYGTDPDSRRIRTCIEAPEDYVLVEVDESQVEMRGMAAYCNEPVLVDAYVNRRDIHQETIDFVFQVAGKTITRRYAKVGNFMIPYGGTDNTFAARLKIPQEEGKLIYGSIEGRYPQVNATKRRMLQQARQTGYTFNIWRGKMAQKRPLWDLDSQDGYKRRKAENGVFNTLIQGTYSGSIVLASHARLVDYILREKLDHLWRPVICIYDSIIGVMHKSIVPFATRMTMDVMTSWDIGRLPDGGVFPLEADAKMGKNLGIAKKYKPPATLREALAESKALGFLEARRDPRRGRQGLLTA